MSGEYIDDRRAVLNWLAGGGIAAAATLAVTQAHGADDEVDLSNVPRAVMGAAERILPRATWHSAIKVVDDERVAYEIDGSDGRGRDVTVMVTAGGKVVGAIGVSGVASHHDEIVAKAGVDALK